MIDTCYVGDVRDGLRAMIAAGVRAQTCVTSPPYWGLRDYGACSCGSGRFDLGQGSGTGGNLNYRPAQQFDASCGKCAGTGRIIGTEQQLGLESTPAEYVAAMVEVFRLVRDVLANDGTLWLNIGDSYAAQGGRGEERMRELGNPTPGAKQTPGARGGASGSKGGDGLKPKDLVGIPWRLAFALQQPYYAGRIKDERDRIWLAAMLDAEGCIFIHKRKAGQGNGQGYERQSDNYAPGIEICNTSRAIIDRIELIVGKGSVCSQGPEQNGRRRQTIFRWNLRTTECRELVRELYPYLVGKQQQARIMYGCGSSGESASAAHQGLMALHRGSSTDVDFAAPPSCFQPGWYLRSDCIWSKPNPMPESVTDRPTKAHEYLFLLAKSERYHYDAEAISEPAAYGGDELGIMRGDKVRAESMGRAPSGNELAAVQRRESKARGEFNGKTNALEGREAFRAIRERRNKRTVWTVTSQPYADAHFAVMPRALVEPCVLAGSRVGDVVLDPFLGSGTVAQVAQYLGRRWVGCELNSAYVAMQARRTAQQGLELGAA